MDRVGTGICVIFEWENGVGFSGTDMPKVRVGKMNKMGLGFALFLSGKMGLALLGLGCLKVRVGKNE